MVAIGLNSGTSADGLDMAAVKIYLKPQKIVVKFIEGCTVPYPKSLREKVAEAINGNLSVDDTIKLDRRLGGFYGDRANSFLNRLHSNRIKPDFVASHGQTVRHLPGKIIFGRRKESGSLQLGHPETIAAKTSLLTVADFRQADIASGGEGAPITSCAMWHIFGNSDDHRLLINIGGISNYFLLPQSESADYLKARDCGPGNSLLDLAAAEFFDKKYDRNGRLASRGKISQRLMSIMLADSFLKGKYGPSTGRERFGREFLQKVKIISAKLRLTKLDILASLTELTAVTVSKSIHPILEQHGLRKIFVFGGGLKNNYLLERLKYYLPGINIFSVERLNMNPDYLEAVCYAVMGAMALFSISSGLPKITGARDKTVAGRIVQPYI